jgi:hypothetical protein
VIDLSQHNNLVDLFRREEGMESAGFSPAMTIAPIVLRSLGGSSAILVTRAGKTLPGITGSSSAISQK